MIVGCRSTPASVSASTSATVVSAYIPTPGQSRSRAARTSATVAAGTWARVARGRRPVAASTPPTVPEPPGIDAASPVVRTPPARSAPDVAAWPARPRGVGRRRPRPRPVPAPETVIEVDGEVLVAQDDAQGPIRAAADLVGQAQRLVVATARPHLATIGTGIVGPACTCRSGVQAHPRERSGRGHRAHSLAHLRHRRNHHRSHDNAERRRLWWRSRAALQTDCRGMDPRGIATRDVGSAGSGVRCVAMRIVTTLPSLT